MTETPEAIPTIPDLPALESPRLLLRQRDVRDFEEMMRLNGAAEVMRFLHPVEPEADRRRTIAMRISQRFAGGLGYWSVFAKADPDRFLGYVGLIPVNRTGPGVELSYRFHVAALGHGYAREAVERLIRFAFEARRDDCIEIHTHPENARSLHLAAKLGFSEHGTVTVDCGPWKRYAKFRPIERPWRA